MTLPKTYDDMVLRWPFMAWVYWGSIALSGALMLQIGNEISDSVIRFTAQAVGFAIVSYFAFSMARRTVELGDALGFIGAFEKKGER